MLKYVAVLCVVAAVCSAAPQNSQDQVQILRYDNDVQPDGYSFEFETSDGTKRQEVGKIDNPESENAALIVNGEYAYISPDGKKFSVTFKAGPDGFQPQISLAQKK